MSLSIVIFLKPFLSPAVVPAKKLRVSSSPTSPLLTIASTTVTEALETLPAIKNVLLSCAESTTPPKLPHVLPV